MRLLCWSGRKSLEQGQWGVAGCRQFSHRKRQNHGATGSDGRAFDTSGGRSRLPCAGTCQHTRHGCHWHVRQRQLLHAKTRGFIADSMRPAGAPNGAADAGRINRPTLDAARLGAMAACHTSAILVRRTLLSFRLGRRASKNREYGFTRGTWHKCRLRFECVPMAVGNNHLAKRHGSHDSFVF